MRPIMTKLAASKGVGATMSMTLLHSASQQSALEEDGASENESWKRIHALNLVRIIRQNIAIAPQATGPPNALHRPAEDQGDEEPPAAVCNSLAKMGDYIWRQ